MAALLDEVKNTIDSLEGVVKVCRVLEPGLVEECLADVEVVYTTGKRVETDDNCKSLLAMAPQYEPRVCRLTVHAVFVDGVVGDGLEEL